MDLFLDKPKGCFYIGRAARFLDGVIVEHLLVSHIAQVEGEGEALLGESVAHAGIMYQLGGDRLLVVLAHFFRIFEETAHIAHAPVEKQFRVFQQDIGQGDACIGIGLEKGRVG